MGNFPTLKEVMDQAIEAGVKFMVCVKNCILLSLQCGEFTKATMIVGVAALNDLLLKADAILSF